MKKLFCSILLPLLAVICLFGCGTKINIKNVKSNYEELSTSYLTNGVNIFYSNENKPNTISIYYPDNLLEEAINNPAEPVNDLQKRYKALAYQQLILNNIFDSYEKFADDFYTVAESKSIDNSLLESLNNKERELERTLDDFKHSYDNFIDEARDISSVMELTITAYSYELNKVIESSFNFVNCFMDIYTNHCVDNIESINSKNLSINVAKANLDIAYVVYLENIKSFNFTVGKVGMCDLAPLITQDNSFVLIDDLSSPKALSTIVSENLIEGSTKYESVIDNVNNFNYAKKLFEQRLKTYQTMYSELDMFNLSQFRFDQKNGVSYNNYIDSLTASKKTNVQMVETFINTTLTNYIIKLKTITE